MNKSLILGVTAAVALAVATSTALAGGAPTRAVGYINPDKGAPTENRNVEDNSGCKAPDARDRQRLSSEGATNRNVHMDACLFAGRKAFDGMVTFASRGPGTISACPDPDQKVSGVSGVMDGPRVAYVHDHNEDGRIEHCHQTGYQVKDAAGDREYHVRLNNDDSPGRQRVTFCFDPEQDNASNASTQPGGHGCGDDGARSKIVIRWVK